MKKIIPILSIAAVMAACNHEVKPAADASSVTPVKQEVTSNLDTAGLAQFQQWKAEQQALIAQKQPVQTVRYIVEAPAKKSKKVYTKPAKTVTSSAASSSSNSVDNNQDVAMNSESSNTAKAPEKKGWSKAAKGAVIGGAGGAVAGAVINKKNRAVGAVIGGVLGAGGGYAIGRTMDKKDGRY